VIARSRAIGASSTRDTHHPPFPSVCRWRSRVGVSGLAARLVGGWWPGRDGFRSELRPGFAGHDYRHRQRWWRRRRRGCRRRCHLCGCRRERERGVGLERRPQHRGAQTSRLGRLATIQPAAASAATPGATPVHPRHGVQLRLLRRVVRASPVPRGRRLPAYRWKFTRRSVERVLLSVPFPVPREREAGCGVSGVTDSREGARRKRNARRENHPVGSIARSPTSRQRSKVKIDGLVIELNSTGDGPTLYRYFAFNIKPAELSGHYRRD